MNTKVCKYILPVLAAGAIAASMVPTKPVQAEDNLTDTLPVYDISMSDTNPVETLKEKVISDMSKKDAAIDLNNIDVKKSTIDVSNVDYTKTGIQAVKLKVSLADKDSATTSLGYSFTEDAAINMLTDSAPKLLLKASSVIVNNGDTFNPESYVSYVSDNSGILPALTTSGDVDMSTDGIYQVTYTAVDVEGNKASQVLNVTVKTPQEVLDAQAQAEADAQAEAERQAQEQAAQQAAAQSQQQASYISYGAPVVGSGFDPYGGGSSNCTDEAWLQAYAAGHVLPNWGNATSWLYNAQATGYSTGYAPAAGAIAVYSHHVAYVDHVNADGTVYIKEGGFNGGYNERTVAATGTGTQALQGYIYLNQ